MPAYILTNLAGGCEYLFTLQILSGELGMLTTHLHKNAKPRIQRQLIWTNYAYRCRSIMSH